jgi:hypothetical protein
MTSLNSGPVKIWTRRLPSKSSTRMVSVDRDIACKSFSDNIIGEETAPVTWMSEPAGATIPDGAGVDVAAGIVEGTADVGSAGSVVAETEGKGVVSRCAAIAAVANDGGAPQPTASATHDMVAKAIHPSRTRISFHSS